MERILTGVLGFLLVPGLFLAAGCNRHREAVKPNIIVFRADDHGYDYWMATHNNAGPGHIKPGSVSKVPVIGTDIFATVLEVAGIPLPDDRRIDGVSLIPAFAGEPLLRKIPLFWRMHISDPGCRVAARVGDWKLEEMKSTIQIIMYISERNS